MLKKYLLCPATDTPYTSIKVDIVGTENSRPTYQHYVKCKETDDFALNIFEEEFKDKFLEKLKKVESHGRG